MAQRGPTGREPLPTRNELKVAENAFDWLKEKASADQERTGVAADLWCVHGKLYDLSSFMDKHPGGKQWLEFTKGSEITEAYETHHLDEAKTDAILKKYYVRDAPVENYNTIFTWKEDGFYKTLKRRVFKVLSNHGGTGPSLQMKALSALAILLWCVTFAATCVTGSIPVAFVAGYFLYVLLGVGHNFLHLADNWWMFAFDFSCFSSRNFRITHAYSHHAFTNLDIDYEASALEPYVRFMRNQPSNPITIFVTWHIFHFVMSTMDYVGRIISVLLGKEKFHPETLLVPLEVALLIYSWGTWHGLLLFLIMQGTAGYMLMIFSTPVHRSEFGWTEGCPDPADDFGHHIVLSTDDYNVHAPLWMKLFFFASFNDHLIHHMFPTIDLSKGEHLREVFEQTLHEFNMPYESHSFKDLVLGTARVLYRTDLMYTKANVKKVQ